MMQLMVRLHYSATERVPVSTDSESMFLIYEGEHFEVEFYFDENGEMQGREEFEVLTENEKAAFLARAVKLADSAPGTIHPKTIFNLEDEKEKIFAIKF